MSETVSMYREDPVVQLYVLTVRLLITLEAIILFNYTLIQSPHGVKAILITLRHFTALSSH